ncbi:MAG: bifunctional folylpolyglutamate synthase/dihydrofolate synthase [Anaerolineae bacterium]|nr:bifunctional folylpolyglutamate synthase/dihydrofolate synthase [Anaerolineae bacterium]
MDTDYRAALDYLYGYTDYEVKSGYDYSPERFDLRRVHKLLGLLGDPHHSFRSVHIAGTKGKGSTSALIASVLRRAGFRTGLYTSPHLHSFRERIQIDGQLIPEHEVIAGVDRLRAIAPDIAGITTFELITALAFDYMRAHGVEWAVLEVGMGGRLDATNVIVPAVSVITSISYDHMMYLGDTLAAIAAEKAGIIKPGIPVVSAVQHPEAARVIARTAAERGAPLTLVGEDWRWSSESATTEGQRLRVWQAGAEPSAATYTLPLLGRHQQENAVTAIAAIAQLQAGGAAIGDDAVHAGLDGVRWPGRLEILGRTPWVVVDGAHNPDSMTKLLATLEELFPHRRLIAIFGASADKQIDAMLDILCPAADHVLMTQARHPRAADAAQLVERVRARNVPAEALPSGAALARALSLADRDDLICGTGSLFVVAELRAAWFAATGQPAPPTDPPG